MGNDNALKSGEKPADPPKEPSVEELRNLLGDNVSSDEDALPAEPKPVTPEKSEGKDLEVKPATPEGEKPLAEATSDSGTDATQEGKDQPRDKEGKFKPKDDGEPPPGVKKAISKAIWEKHNAERERDTARRENEELKRKLALKDQAPEKPAEKSAEKSAPAFAEPEPDAKDTAKYPEGQYDPKFIKDLTSWQNWKDRFEARQQDEADREKQRRDEAQRTEKASRRTLEKGWMDRVAGIEEAHPEIHEAIDNVGPLLTVSNQADMVMEAERGPEIILYMHEHPEETMKVAQHGTPGAVARYIGKIEAELGIAGAKPPAKELTPTPPKQRLPEPVAPVGGSSTPPKAVDLNDEKISQKQFREEFDRQLKAAVNE